MGKPRMIANKIARLVVEDLFVNGSGKHAERLVLTSPTGQDLGGWGKGGAADRIQCIVQACLQQHMKPTASTKTTT